MKLFAIAALTAAVGIVIGLALRTGVLHQGADSGIAASVPDPAAAEIRKLIKAGRGRRPAEQRIRVLTHHVAGGTWHLAYSSTKSLICWVLIVPRGRPVDGTCAAPKKIRHRRLVAYGGTLDTGGPNSHTVFLVYGWVWARVKVLRVLLSDCSALRVNLSSRPIYWRFVRLQKPGERVVRPTQVIGTLFGGDTEAIRLSRGKHCQKRNH